MNIICPNCHTQYRKIPSKFINRFVNCKKCNHRFKVSEPEVSVRFPQETQLASMSPQETQLAASEASSSNQYWLAKQSPKETQLAPSETPTTDSLSSQMIQNELSNEQDSTSVSINNLAQPQKSIISEIFDSGSECFITEHQNNNHPMNDWRIGDVLLELYEIKAVLGEGQFGKVFQVRHRGWNLDLALKAPKPKALAAGFENIEKEAETWVNLDLHPNIVNCYYVRRIAGIPQIFSEYVDGGDLKELINSKRLYHGDEQKVLIRILDIAIQFAWGLHYAHEQGLIHQDIKPANVMVTSKGVIKITDFGLAKAGAMANVTGQTNDQTMVIAGMGMTPAYASPEQLAGKRLTRRTDLWSWGVCILEMILGYCSWEAGAVAPGVFEAYRDNTLDDAPKLSKIPDAMAQLLENCFHEEEENRSNNLQEVAEVLITIYCDVADHYYPRQQPKAGHGTASSLNNQAISLLDLGKTDEARTLWENALAIDPRHFESSYNMVIYDWKSQGLEESQVIAKIESFSNTIGHSARINLSLARLYLQFGHYDETIKILNDGEDDVIELTSELTDEASKELGLALCAKFRLAQKSSYWLSIVQCLKKAVGNKITDPYTTTAYTLALQKYGQKREASDFFRAASGVGVIPKQFKQAVALFLPGYEVLYRLAKKNIAAIEFINGGENILFSQGKQLIVWSLKSNQLLLEMDGHIGKITAIIVSPDKERIISASEQGEIRVWGSVTGESLQVWSAHKERINAIAITACGRFLITASSEKILCLWDIDNASQISTFYGVGHDADITDIHISPSGSQVVSASNDKVIRIWDIDTGRSKKILSGHEMGVSCVRWLDDNSILSGSHDKSLRLWDVAMGKTIRIFKGHAGTINSLRIAAEKNYAVSGSSDGHIRYWNLKTGTSNSLSQFSGPVVALAIDNSEQFALAATQSGIALFESSNPFRYQAPFIFSEPESASEVDKLQRRYQHNLTEALSALNKKDSIMAMDFLTQARSLKGYERDFDAFKRWSDLYLLLPKLKLKDVWRLAELKQHNERVTVLTVSPGKNILYSASKDCSILQWDIESRQAKSHIPQFEQAISNISLTPDGTGILVAYGENIKMINATTGRVLSLFAHHSGNVTAATITTDGRFALSADNKGTFYLWRLLTGDLMADFSNEKYIVSTMVMTPDGRYAVTGHRNNNLLCIWSMETGKVETILEEHEQVVTSIAVSSNGRYILSGSADSTLRLWQVQSSRKKSVRIFRGHTKRIYQVVMDYQRKIAISASEDKSVRIWDITNGDCLYTFTSIESDFTSCSMSLDGMYAYAGHADGRISVWCLDWLLDKKIYNAWDNDANIYLKNYLSSHTITKPHEELDKIHRILAFAGYGWLEKNETGLKLLELFQLQESNVLPAGKVIRTSSTEVKKSSQRKSSYYAILPAIIIIVGLAFFFLDSDKKVETETDSNINISPEQLVITDKMEQHTVDKMLNIAVLLAKINRQVVVVNNRIDQRSLVVPSGVKQLRQILSLGDNDLVDAWGQEFMYKGVKVGVFQGRIILRSSGKDKINKTDDDLLLNGYPYWDSLEVRKNNQLIIKLSSYMADKNILLENEITAPGEQDAFINAPHSPEEGYQDEDLVNLNEQTENSSAGVEEFRDEETNAQEEVGQYDNEADEEQGLEIKNRAKIYVDEQD